MIIPEDAIFCHTWPICDEASLFLQLVCQLLENEEQPIIIVDMCCTSFPWAEVCGFQHDGESTPSSKKPEVWEGNAKQSKVIWNYGCSRNICIYRGSI
ncbi:hypothetical protein LguiB_000233 [Lonicera macranthoides]